MEPLHYHEELHQKVLQAYAPHVWIHPEERYYPVSIEYVKSCCEDGTWGISASLGSSTLGGSKCVQATPLYAHIRKQTAYWDLVYFAIVMKTLPNTLVDFLHICTQRIDAPSNATKTAKHINSSVLYLSPGTHQVSSTIPPKSSSSTTAIYEQFGICWRPERVVAVDHHPQEHGWVRFRGYFGDNTRAPCYHAWWNS